MSAAANEGAQDASGGGVKPFAAAKLEIELLVTPCPTPSQLLLKTIESRTNKCLQRSSLDAR